MENALLLLRPSAPAGWLAFRPKSKLRPSCAVRVCRGTLFSADNAGAFRNQQLGLAVLIHRRFVLHPVFVSSTHERREQRMRIQGLRLVFRMKLTTEKPRVFIARELNYFNELPIGRNTAKNQTGAFQSLAKLRIKLVTMPVALANLFGSVNFLCQRARVCIPRQIPK